MKKQGLVLALNSTSDIKLVEYETLADDKMYVKTDAGFIPASCVFPLKVEQELIQVQKDWQALRKEMLDRQHCIFARLAELRREEGYE